MAAMKREAIREFIDEHGDDYRADELRTRLGELD